VGIIPVLYISNAAAKTDISIPKKKNTGMVDNVMWFLEISGVCAEGSF